MLLSAFITVLHVSFTNKMVFNKMYNLKYLSNKKGTQSNGFNCHFWKCYGKVNFHKIPHPLPPKLTSNATTWLPSVYFSFFLLWGTRTLSNLYFSYIVFSEMAIQIVTPVFLDLIGWTMWTVIIIEINSVHKYFPTKSVNTKLTWL